ncbi:hypothetical protein BDV18DRAFT_163385 [Aspergillus unguis]
MLQPRAMLLRSRRIGRSELSTRSIRQFSIFGSWRADSPSNPSRPPRSTSDQPKKLKIPPALLKYKSSGPDKPRPRRVFDARSLGSSKPGGPSGNILKGPRRPGARSGPPPRGRKPLGAKAPTRDPRKTGRFHRQRDSDTEGPGETLAEELESVYKELADQTKPTPTRYQPQPPDLHNLSESWPSMPTDVTATAAGIAEKLSSLSDRYPNGYVPPYVLGKRLVEGKYVRFRNEPEKEEALEAAKKFAQEAADKLSQEKGELVDPQAIKFEGVKGEEHRSLIEALAQGKYPTLEATGKKSPIVGEIMKNLRNNETYEAPGKKLQFMAKVESLLVASRPVKRV